MFTRSLVEASASATKSNETDQVRPAIPPLRGHGKPVDQRLPRHVPTERARLLSAIGTLGQPQRVPLDLPHVQVKELDCTACGLCAKFCSTGALRFQSDEPHFALDFIPAVCVDCSICAKACPTKAIALAHDLSLQEFIDIKACLLVAGDLGPCAVCQKPTAFHSSGSRCEVCRAVPDRRILASDLFASLQRSTAQRDNP